jgi:glutamine amidotransferase
MCELFAACAKNKHRLNDYLRLFYSHSNNHPHGWGLACVEGNHITIEKETLQASQSHYLKERLSQPIETNTLLAHIRYATIGNIDYCNCHPYSKKDNFNRRWTLIHNGTIFDFPALSKFISKQSGETDSERILLYIVDKINQEQSKLGHQLTFEERFALIDTIVCEMSKNNNKLNLILYDGHYMYVHTNYKNSLYFLTQGDLVMFSTTPLDDDDWQNVPFTTLLAYKKGKLVATGTNHGGEYVDNEESLKFLYQIFSDL